MGKGAWGCVLTGTVFIAAAVFYIVIVARGGGHFEDAQVPSAVLAVIGALLIGAALRTRTRAARAFVPVGVVLITVAAVMLLAPRLREGPVAIVGCVGVLLVTAGWLGSRSRRQAREAQTAKPIARPSRWHRKSVAAAVLVLAVVGGVLGFTLWPSPRHGFTPTIPTYSPAPSSYSAAPSSAPPAGSAGLQKLLSLLPKGYPASACTSEPQRITGAVAEVVCGANLDQGGPTRADYTLYTGLTTMNTDFANIAAKVTLAPCTANMPASGTSWHHPDAPSQAAGMVSCGTYKNSPNVVWTDNARLVLGFVSGSDAAALYQWWFNHAG
jgi:serine/threonine-protein kinase